MSSAPQIPFELEQWFPDGKPTTQAFDFFNAVNDLFGILNQGVFPISEYATKTAANDALPNRQQGWTVNFTGQGFGFWDIGVNDWLSAADGTTPIT